MDYSLNFDEYYAQIIENENAPIKALLYKREMGVKGSTLKLVCRTFAKDIFEAADLLDLFVEEGGES